MTQIARGKEKETYREMNVRACCVVELDFVNCRNKLTIKTRQKK